jgi:hypothetical protein
MRQFRDQFVINETENVGPRFNHGDGNIQCAENRGVFDPDDASANNSQRSRQINDVEDLVAVQNAVTVKRDVVWTVRLGADTDQRRLEANFFDEAAWIRD